MPRRLVPGLVLVLAVALAPRSTGAQASGAAVPSAGTAPTAFRDGVSRKENLAAPRPRSGAAVFGLTRMHHVELGATAEEWAVLENETAVLRGRGGGAGTDSLKDDFHRPDGRLVHIGGGFGGHFPWIHASLTIGGREIPDVGLRYKGNGSYNPGAGLHRNMKVKTDLFGGGGDWDRLETINFNSGGRDLSRIRESLAYALFRAAGVPAPRTAFAEVTVSVPGEHESAPAGLFTVIENVNKRFLRETLPPGTGLLMKPERMTGGVGYYGEDWAAYVAVYRPEREATLHERRRVMELAWLVNRSAIDVFRDRIASYVDVDEFLRFVAVNALIANRDSFLAGRHNYFIYLDPSDDRFRFLPWDVDLTFSYGGGRGSANMSSETGMDLIEPFTGSNPLMIRLLDDPIIEARYRGIVREMLRTVFTRGWLLETIDELEAVVREPLGREAVAMRARGEYNLPTNSWNLREFVLRRLDEVHAQVNAWPEDGPGAKVGRLERGEVRRVEG